MRKTARAWAALVVLLACAAGIWQVGRFLRRLYPLDYREIILREAKANRLDPMLVAAVIRAESRFQAGARSGKGAIGLMQVMPQTGEWAADQLKMDGFRPEMLYEPEVNLRVGCWYLARLLAEFDRDLTLAIAAYNAGRGNVREWVGAHRDRTDRPYGLSQIPFAETRRYVRAVMRGYRMYTLLYGSPK